MSKSTFAFGTDGQVSVTVTGPISSNDLSGSTSHFGNGVSVIVNGINLISPDGNETYWQAYGQTDGADGVTPWSTSQFPFLGTVSRLTVFNGTTGKWDRVRTDGTQGSILVGQPTASNMNVAASLAEMAVSVRSMLSAIKRPMWWDRTRNTLRVDGDLTPADAVSPVDVVGAESFGMAFNGTTWDRIRSSTNNTGAIFVTVPPTEPYLQWDQRSAWAQIVRARIS